MPAHRSLSPNSHVCVSLSVYLSVSDGNGRRHQARQSAGSKYLSVAGRGHQSSCGGQYHVHVPRVLGSSRKRSADTTGLWGVRGQTLWPGAVPEGGQMRCDPPPPPVPPPPSGNPSLKVSLLHLQRSTAVAAGCEASPVRKGKRGGCVGCRELETKTRCRLVKWLQLAPSREVHSNRG